MNFREEISPLNFSVEATNLKEDVLLSVDGEFLISRNHDSNFTDSLRIMAYNEFIPNTQIFIDMKTNSSGEKIGLLTVSTSGIESTINLLGNVLAPEPNIDVDRDIISFELINIGEISPPQSFAINAEFLTEVVQISSTEEFEI